MDLRLLQVPTSRCDSGCLGNPAENTHAVRGHAIPKSAGHREFLSVLEKRWAAFVFSNVSCSVTLCSASQVEIIEPFILTIL